MGPGAEAAAHQAALTPSVVPNASPSPTKRVGEGEVGRRRPQRYLDVSATQNRHPGSLAEPRRGPALFAQDARNGYDLLGLELHKGQGELCIDALKARVGLTLALVSENRMSDRQKRVPKREYPPFYEKAVPIALGCIGVAILVMLFVGLAVVLGWFPR